MKKTAKILSVILIVFLIAGINIGCGENTFSVNFRYNYPGASPASAEVKVDAGSNVERPSAPSRVRYRFDDWYKESSCKNKFDFESSVNEDLNLYAGWVQTEALIEFDLNYTGGVGAPADIIVAIGEKAIAPTAPQRSGWAFIGWYTDSRQTELFSFADDVLSEDITLYAGWSQTDTVVSFSLNYTTTDLPPADIYVEIGKTVSEPTAPKREGYDFDGWYTDIACQDAFDFGTAVNSGFTLYAGWKQKEYDVELNLNYPDSASPTITKIKHGEKFVKPTDPERPNFTFVGWYLSAAATGEQYNFSSLVTAPIKLYSGWVASTTNTVTYTYYLNDGTEKIYQTDSIRIGRTAKEPTTPTNGKYYFAGWFLNAEGTGTAYDFGSAVTQSRKLYARWYVINTFEAEYTNLDGKKGADISGNGEGPGYLIQSESSVNNADFADPLEASNGYFINKLVMNGAYLDFEITASKATSDAVVILRLTSWILTQELTDDEYQVLVNGNKLNYGSVSLEAYDYDAQGEYNLVPFKNYELAVPVTLIEGKNTIRLLANNEYGYSATYQALMPVTDCIYVCTDQSVALTWQPRTDNLGG